METHNAIQNMTELIQQLQGDVYTLCEQREENTKFMDTTGAFCKTMGTAITKMQTDFTNMRKRINGIGQLVKNLVDTVAKQGVQNVTVSPPPGRVAERSRSLSNTSTSSYSSSRSASSDGKDSANYTEIPTKPARDEIRCTALKDGWLFHGNTYNIRDMIRANGGKWFNDYKGWVVRDKNSASRIIKKTSIKISLEKIKNTLVNLGFRVYNPNEAAKPRILKDDEVKPDNTVIDSFINDDESGSDSDGGSGGDSDGGSGSDSGSGDEDSSHNEDIKENTQTKTKKTKTKTKKTKTNTQTKAKTAKPTKSTKTPPKLMGVGTCVIDESSSDEEEDRNVEISGDEDED